jgi:hypothetical protein
MQCASALQQIERIEQIHEFVGVLESETLRDEAFHDGGPAGGSVVDGPALRRGE